MLSAFIDKSGFGYYARVGALARALLPSSLVAFVFEFNLASRFTCFCSLMSLSWQLRFTVLIWVKVPD